jgi:predicted O-methyltransferase YrrM
MEIVGWFPEENQEVLSRLIQVYDVRTVIEVGCFVGKATAWFAERVDHVTAIDKFEPFSDVYINSTATKEASKYMHSTFMQNMDEAGVADKISVIKASSEAAAAMGLQADLVYVDASHAYEDVKQDIVLWYPIAEKVLCGDDNTIGWPGVQNAVRESELPIDYSQRVWWTAK